MPLAQFKFHSTLVDFIRPRNKHSLIEYSFRSPPSIKDAIEVIGIPHVEVKEIVVNGNTAGFNYHLKADDMVEVFPYTQISFLPPKFILDVHLGKLARLLRLLGFDTLYQNDYTDKTIAAIANGDDRIVLTRDIGLLKHKSIKSGYWLRSQQPIKQLDEVLYRFALKNKITPFKRCMAFNGIIENIEKESVTDLLQTNTAASFNEFYQCRSCKKIYWKGSHHERMIDLVENI